jgi:hypothetical protein
MLKKPPPARNRLRELAEVALLAEGELRILAIEGIRTFLFVTRPEEVEPLLLEITDASLLRMLVAAGMPGRLHALTFEQIRKSREAAQRLLGSS